MRRTLTLLLLLGIAFGGSRTANAQDPWAKRDKDLVKADKLYAIGHWSGAIPLYERGLQRTYEAESCARLADAQRHQGHYLAAEHWYRQAVLAENLDPIHYRDYAQVLRANGKPERARRWFERYDRYTVDPGAYRADFDLAAKERALAPSWRVVPLALNSPYREIAPAFYGEALMLAADRPRKDQAATAPQTGGAYLDLFLVEPQPGEPGTQTPTRIRGKLNGPWHEAGYAKDPLDGSAWITRTTSRGAVRQRNSVGTVTTSLYRSPLKGDRLRRPERFAAVRKTWNSAHPAFSPEGDRLYFSSDRPGGAGGMDIWFCERRAGSWSEPQNAGPQINTPGNETWPHCAGADRLYFSSDGHPGLGGLDLYVVDKTANGWDVPRHLPSPMSSPRDDFSLVVRDNQGFLASDRLGGAGLDDLYAFERISVPVDVAVVNAHSGQPVAGVSVELIPDGEDNRVQRTNARGEAHFDWIPGKAFYLSLQKKGFATVLVEQTQNRERFVMALEPLSEEAPPSKPSNEPAQESGTSDPKAPASSPAVTTSPATPAPNETDPAAKESKAASEETPRLATMEGYRIRIGLYRNPDRQRLESLKRFGTLLEEARPEGVSAFYIGTFEDAASAADVLARVRLAGFPDAYVERVKPK